MGSAQEEATKAVRAFYEGLERLLQGRGTAALNAVWHQGPDVSTSHPFGEWARGWEEVSATWEESLAVWAVYKGHVGRTDPISHIENLNVVVIGDVALATCVFKNTMYMTEGPLRLVVNCTNVVQRIDGVWKIIHHHADHAPADWGAAIGAMVQRGHS